MTLLTVYFIRHGQAGSRHDYDRLSDVGRAQSERLGAWFARMGIQVDAAWSGRLSRQRETAAAARHAARAQGLDFPEAAVDPCWDEFDLDSVYRAIGPQLSRDDPEFRLQYQEFKLQARDHHSSVHRRWAPCDTTVVRTWIEGRYRFEGESFPEFVQRVRAGSALFQPHLPHRTLAVFTSATPAAVWAAQALDLEPRKIMQLAGVTYNTGITVLRLDPARLRLFQFNATPHIETPDLLTHR